MTTNHRWMIIIFFGLGLALALLIPTHLVSASDCVWAPNGQASTVNWTEGKNWTCPGENNNYYPGKSGSTDTATINVQSGLVTIVFDPAGTLTLAQLTIQNQVTITLSTTGQMNLSTLIISLSNGNTISIAPNLTISGTTEITTAAGSGTLSGTGSITTAKLKVIYDNQGADITTNINSPIRVSDATTIQSSASSATPARNILAGSGIFTPGKLFLTLSKNATLDIQRSLTTTNLTISGYGTLTDSIVPKTALITTGTENSLKLQPVDTLNINKPITGLGGGAVAKTIITGSGTLGGSAAVNTTSLDINSSNCDQAAPVTLASGGRLVCTGVYIATDADYSAGSFTNTATANSTEVSNQTASYTVKAAPALVPGLTLAASIDRTTYKAAGDPLVLTFTATNTGGLPLTNVSITASGIPGCDSSPVTSLAVGASTSCSGVYLITTVDISRGYYSKLATASGTGNATTVKAAANIAASAYQSPSLSLTKTADVFEFNYLGQSIVYTLTATNTGNVSLTGVSVSDAALGSFTCIPAIPAALAPGAKTECTAIHTVTQADFNAGEIASTATATASFISLTLNAQSSLAIPARQVFEVAHGQTQSFTSSGQQVMFMIQVRVFQPLSAVTISFSNGESCSASSMLPGFPPLECISTRTITDADITAGYYVNEIGITGTDGSITFKKMDRDIAWGPSPSADFTLSNTPSQVGFVSAGANIQHLLRVTNTGTVPLSNVSISDPGLSNLTCTAAQPAFLMPTQFIDCMGTSTAASDSSYTNQASAEGTGNPMNPPVTKTASAAVSLARLIVTKTASAPNFYASGDVLTYTYTATNIGDLNLSGLTIVDSDSSITLTSCSAASLAPGAALTCTGSRTIGAADVTFGYVSGTATATGLFTGGSVTASAALAVARVDPHPQIVITKTSDTLTYVLNDKINYTLSVYNTGNTQQSVSTITDSKVSALTCNLALPGKLDPGKTIQCTGSYTATSNDVTNGSITNTAQVQSTSAGQSFNPSTSWTVYAQKANSTRLSLVKASDQVIFRSGDILQYTLTAINTGSTQLTNVAINDPKVDQGGAGDLNINLSITVSDTTTITRAGTVGGSGQMDTKNLTIYPAPPSLTVNKSFNITNNGTTIVSASATVTLTGTGTITTPSLMVDLTADAANLTLDKTFSGLGTGIILQGKGTLSGSSSISSANLLIKPAGVLTVNKPLTATTQAAIQPTASSTLAGTGTITAPTLTVTADTGLIISSPLSAATMTANVTGSDLTISGTLNATTVILAGTGGSITLGGTLSMTGTTPSLAVTLNATTSTAATLSLNSTISGLNSLTVNLISAGSMPASMTRSSDITGLANLTLNLTSTTGATATAEWNMPLSGLVNTTISGSGTLDDKGTQKTSLSTTNLSLQPSGTLTINKPLQAAATATVQSSAASTLNGSSTITTPSLVVDPNTYALQLDSLVYSGLATGVSITGSGTLQGSSSLNAPNMNITPEGTLTIDKDLTATTKTTLSPSADATLDGSGSITTAAFEITVATPRTLILQKPVIASASTTTSGDGGLVVGSSTGALTLDGGGTLGTATLTINGTLTLGGAADFTISTGTVSGTGTIDINLNAKKVEVTGSSFQPGILKLQNGILTSTSDFTFGTFTWLGGTLQGAVRLDGTLPATTVTTTLDLSGSSATRFLDHRKLDISTAINSNSRGTISLNNAAHLMLGITGDTVLTLGINLETVDTGSIIEFTQGKFNYPSANPIIQYKVPGISVFTAGEVDFSNIDPANFNPGGSSITIQGCKVTLPDLASASEPMLLTTLLISSGSLNTPDKLSISNLTWTGGTIGSSTGLPTTDVTGTFSISGTAAKTLDKREMTLVSDFTWNDSGPVLLNNGAKFINKGTFEAIKVRTTIFTSATASNRGEFYNLGTFKINLANTTDTAGMGVKVTNDYIPAAQGNPAVIGHMIITKGIFILNNDGLFRSNSTTVVEADGTLRFAYGLFTLESGSTLTGVGTFENETANTAINGSYSVTTTKLKSGAVTFNNNSGITLSSLEVSGANVAFIDSTMKAHINSLDMKSGAIDSKTDVMIAANLSWSGGSLTGMADIVSSNCSGGAVSKACTFITPALTYTSSVPRLLNGHLTVDGCAAGAKNIDWQGAGTLTMAGTSYFTVSAGCEMVFNQNELNLTMSPQIGADAKLINNGVIYKNGKDVDPAKNPPTNLGVKVTNSGTINLVYPAPAGTGLPGLIIFSNSSNDAYTDTANGIILLNGGEIRANNTSQTLTLSQGKLIGFGTITGSLKNNGGTLIIQPSIEVSGGQTTNFRRLVVTGSFTQSDTGKLRISPVVNPGQGKRLQNYAYYSYNKTSGEDLYFSPSGFLNVGTSATLAGDLFFAPVDTTGSPITKDWMPGPDQYTQFYIIDFQTSTGPKLYDGTFARLTTETPVQDGNSMYLNSYPWGVILTFMPGSEGTSLNITKTDNLRYIKKGNDITYEIQVTNAGPNPLDLSWAYVYDVLPAGSTFKSWDCSIWDKTGAVSQWVEQCKTWNYGTTTYDLGWYWYSDYDGVTYFYAYPPFRYDPQKKLVTVITITITTPNKAGEISNTAWIFYSANTGSSTSATDTTLLTDTDIVINYQYLPVVLH